MSSTLPMAAVSSPPPSSNTPATALTTPPQMFTRNKMIGWTAVIFAVQGWLNETPGQLANGKQPAYFSVGMSVMALGMVSLFLGERRRGGVFVNGVQTYLPLFMPSMMNKAASATGPADPTPQ